MNNLPQENPIKAPASPNAPKAAAKKATSWRIDQAQAAILFWGTISVLVTFAACYFFVQYQNTDQTTRSQRDQILSLNETIQSLKGEKVRLQELNSDTIAQLNTREQLLRDKEEKLTQEESRLADVEQYSAELKRKQRIELVVQNKFAVLARKLSTNADDDLVLQNNRPLFRVANSQLFAPGETTLKPEGRDLLTKLLGGLDHLDALELRVTVYADSEPEASPAPTKPDPAKDKDKPKEAKATDTKAAAKPLSPWEITAARAVSLERFLKDNGTFPLEHIITLARGDLNPLSPTAGNKNRRTELMLVPEEASLPSDAITLPPPDPVAVQAIQTAAAANSSPTPAPDKASKTESSTLPSATPTSSPTLKNSTNTPPVAHPVTNNAPPSLVPPADVLTPGKSAQN